MSYGYEYVCNVPNMLGGYCIATWQMLLFIIALFVMGFIFGKITNKDTEAR